MPAARKIVGRPFRKGTDPRRHRCTAACTHDRYEFTAADRSNGFWQGLATYVEKGGEARNFLKGGRGPRARRSS
jgi:hypothetical protein